LNNCSNFNVQRSIDGTPVKIDPEGAIGWVELIRCSFSPFVDTRKNSATQPETRMYKMQYLEKDQPVGLVSDIIKVVAAIY